MFCTFLIMAAIEITLLIEKPGARLFAGSVVAVGLVLHGISVVSKRRHPAVPKSEIERAPGWPSHFELPEGTTYGSPMLCAVRGIGRTILGAPRRSMLVKLVRGSLIRQVSRFLPENIHLLLYA
jgi:hypothetical protein